MGTRGYAQREAAGWMDPHHAGPYGPARLLVSAAGRKRLL